MPVKAGIDVRTCDYISVRAFFYLIERVYDTKIRTRLGSENIIIETGRMAKQADGACY